MNKKPLFTIILYVILICTPAAFCAAQNKINKSQPADVDPAFHSLIFSSQVSYWIWADCTSGKRPENLPGFVYYPGYSGYYEPLSGVPLVYTDGILWGGKVYDNKKPELRVSGSVYFAGLQPGIIQNGTSVNPAADRNIWTTLERYYTPNTINMMAQIIYNKSENEVNDHPELTDPFLIKAYDSESWPWQYGAPFTDNIIKNNIFDPGETAGIKGSEMTVWTVSNDLDSALCMQEFKCPSTGMEIQQTAWIYNIGSYLLLHNIIFKRYRFIYKGTKDTPDSARIDSMYITIFCDPDIGEYSNDCAGCDTSLNMMFAYNADPSEPVFDKFDIAPMSIGYTLVQGPVVNTGNLSDRAMFCGREISGYKNLGISAFNYLKNDPLADTENHRPFSETWYKYMKGINYLTSTSFKTSDGNPTQFPFSGDPVIQSGDLDTYFGTGGSDRRIMLHTGPFTMALGDTQEVIIAITAATGPDYLASISNLKYLSESALQTAKNNFNSTAVPPCPAVQGSSVKDGIVITWNSDRNYIENWQKQGYAFEGYNVYYKSANNETKRIATFDLKNGISVISQKYFDYQSGLVLSKAVQHGTDSGLQYFYKIDRYKTKLSEDNLIYGQTYCFGVSSYARSVDSENLLSSVEGPVKWVNVQFEPLPIGTRVQNQFGDTLTVSHISGSGSGEIKVCVISPLDLTGDEYKVTFDRHGNGALYWSLTDISDGSLLLYNQTNFAEDLNYPVTHGFMVVTCGAPDINAVVQTADKNGNLDPDQYDEKGADFNGNWIWNDLPAGGEEYYISFINYDTPQWKSAIQNAYYHDFEIRFNDSENYIIDQENNIANIPFGIYDIGVNTWDNTSDDIPCIIRSRLKRTETDSLFFGFTFHTAGDYLPCTEPIEILRPESKDIYNNFIQDISDGSLDNKELLDKCSVVLKGLVFVNNQKEFPSAGTIIRIILNKPFSTEDVFRFYTTKPEYSAENAEKDAEKITIVPNPYYGQYYSAPNYETSTDSDPQYVTFHHLPKQAVIRIFDLAGNHVRTIEKNDNSQYLRWDMKNRHGMLIANGLYIIRIDMPQINAVKILKFLVCHY